jgi:hypothetical protein
MQEQDSRYFLRGIIHIDDTYLDGDLIGGRADCGSKEGTEA